MPTTIDAQHLSIRELAVGPEPATGLNVRDRIDALEVELVTEAMNRTEGNQTRAAKLLGVSRSQADDQRTELAPLGAS